MLEFGKIWSYQDFAPAGPGREPRGGNLAGKVLFVVAEAELKKEASVKRRGVVPVSVVGLSLAVGNGAMRL